MPRLTAAILCLLTWLVAPSSHAAEIPAITGDTLVIGDTTLMRTSHGTRNLLFVDVYDCSLYLPHAIKDLPEMKATGVPIGIVIDVLIGDPPENMPDRWRQTLRSEISDRAFRNLKHEYRKVDAGDRLMFVYREGEGTTAFFKGRKMFADPGKGLMNGLLDQWMGDNPVSDQLRTDLLNVVDTTSKSPD